LAVLWAGGALGCGAPEPAGVAIEARVAGPAKPWTKLETGRGAAAFRFAVVADRTGGHREGVFRSALGKLDLVAPDFVMSVGDLIEGYTDDAAALNRQWDEFERAVAGLSMPFFYVPGNHDMSSAAMAEMWQRRFGPSYYHFVHGNVLFLVLNSELFGMVHAPDTALPGPWKQREQLAWLEAVLEQQRGARWTFVFVHQPLWDRGPEVHPDWLRVEALLGERPYTVFAGHTHNYAFNRRRGRDFITLATTGGGSRLRGPAWGEFDHIAHVTLTPEGPVIANLLLDGIRESTLRGEDMRSEVKRLERAITAAPILGQGRSFRTGAARFAIANTGDAVLNVRGRFHGGRDLEALDKTAELSLAPGDATALEVKFRAKSPAAYESLAPAWAHWTLATTSGGAALEIERESIVIPERLFEVKRAPRPIMVDGDLADWDALNFRANIPGEREGGAEHRGAADGSFRFGVAHDGEFLYLGVRVRDDSLVAGDGRSVQEQDHVAIRMDARPDPERSRNHGLAAAYASGAVQKIIWLLAPLGETRHDQIAELLSGLQPEGVQSAAARSANGYAAEFAIPFRALDERRGADWDALRINVSVTDYDAGERGRAVLNWRPERFGGRAVPGMGTFLRR